MVLAVLTMARQCFVSAHLALVGKIAKKVSETSPFLTIRGNQIDLQHILINAHQAPCYLILSVCGGSLMLPDPDKKPVSTFVSSQAKILSLTPPLSLSLSSTKCQ